MVISEKIMEEAKKARRRLSRPRGWRAEVPATPTIDRYLQEQQQPKVEEVKPIEDFGAQQPASEQPEPHLPVLDQMNCYR